MVAATTVVVVVDEGGLIDCLDGCGDGGRW